MEVVETEAIRLALAVMADVDKQQVEVILVEGATPLVVRAVTVAEATQPVAAQAGQILAEELLLAKEEGAQPKVPTEVRKQVETDRVP